MKVFTALILLLVLAACAHHRDVRPGADGMHRVVIVAEERDEGARSAIRQANHFCKEQNKYAAFVNEDSKYTGSMPEEDYRKMKTIGKVAQVAGGTVYVGGGKRESNLGGIVATGGAVADIAAGRGYTVDMKFKCQ